MPKVPEEPLEPVNLEALRAMWSTCRPSTFTRDRDKALLLFLLDSGVRHRELTDSSMGDVDLGTGSALVRSGKGRKPRTTVIGARSRRALLAYLKHWGNLTDGEPIWATDEARRLSYGGIREVIRRRARQAGVPEPRVHAFRQGFAINALRGGCDLMALQRMLGHSDLSVVARYLKQVEGDLQAARARVGPVDHLL